MNWKLVAYAPQLLVVTPLRVLPRYWPRPATTSMVTEPPAAWVIRPLCRAAVQTDESAV